MKKRTWRKNISASRVAYHMITPALVDMMLYQSKTLGRIAIPEIVAVQKDYEFLAAYIPVDQLRDMVDATIRIIQRNPARIEMIHRKTEQYNTDYFEYGRAVLKMKLEKFSNQRLANVYRRLNWYQRIIHGYAIATTWFVDSDGEDFSKLLMGKLKDVIRAQRSRRSVAEAFSTLTTPARPSLAIREEIELLTILRRIARDPNAKKIFLQKNIAHVERDLPKIEKTLRRKIYTHYQRWHWTPYTYIGPSYTLEYYLSGWSGLLREKTNIGHHLRKLQRYASDVRKARGRIVHELRLDAATRRLFDIAAQVVYLKGYRKDALFFGCYVLERLHLEIAKRLGLTLKQIRFMGDWEVVPALQRMSFPARVLNERMKFSVYYQKKLRGIIYTGKKAELFLATLRIEKEEVKKVDSLNGTCACPGKVRGIVKIVNVPEEMGKMNRGDIMVAHTTFPALVSAMKKATAIITDDGGITCHAAIVARELKTPCVVGTKIATQVFKDGDRVEVDADAGTVKKI